MKTARSIFCICIFINSFTLHAATNKVALIEEAEQAYASAQYDKAIDLWTHLYTQNNSDPELLINMGNAHAMLGNSADAMTMYEKALRFKPSDNELNLAIKDLRERNENSVEPVQSFFIIRWVNVFLALFRPFVWALAGLLFLLAGMINWLSTINLITGKFRFTKGNFQIYGIIGTLLLGISILSYQNIYRRNEAIVFNTCDVHQGPSGQSPLVRSLNEGEKVKCSDHISGWTKVQLLNLEEGWIKDECIRTIDLHARK